jgi:hypothetical protein
VRRVISEYISKFIFSFFKLVMNQKDINFSTCLYFSIQTLLLFLTYLRFYVNCFQPVNLSILLSNNLFIYICIMLLIA